MQNTLFFSRKRRHLDPQKVENSYFKSQTWVGFVKRPKNLNVNHLPLERLLPVETGTANCKRDGKAVCHVTTSGSPFAVIVMLKVPIIYRGGGLLSFRKVVEKKCDPPLQHDKKNYNPSPAKGEKNCNLPPYPFFYFHLIFFNKNNIFTRRCAPSSNYFVFS